MEKICKPLVFLGTDPTLLASYKGNDISKSLGDTFNTNPTKFGGGGPVSPLAYLKSFFQKQKAKQSHQNPIFFC